MPPLRYHCVEGRWDWTQDCCDFGIDTQSEPDTLTTRLDYIHTRLDLIQNSARSHTARWNSYSLLKHTCREEIAYNGDSEKFQVLYIKELGFPTDLT